MGYPYQAPRPGSYRDAGPLRMTWVATPPPGAMPPPRPVPRPHPYLGPPAYPAAPRWGLPRLAWRTSTAVPGTVRRDRVDAAGLRGQARLASVVLWIVAAAALLAGGGEIWRYTLLVLGRDEALSATVVTACDDLVLASALLAVFLGLLALALTVRWLRSAGELAGELAGYAPARRDWQLLLGILLPVVNLVVAGSVLAELEHTARNAPPNDRPAPSRLVLAWWAAWVLGEVLAIGALVVGLSGDLQSRADDVLWHAGTDLVAVVVAVLTIRALHMITGLLAPDGRRPVPLGTLVDVRDAPAPALRPTRPAGAVR